MKNERRDADKELYRQLRALPCDILWKTEVARFDQASPTERLARVAVIRAVGVVVAESGTSEQNSAARAWLVSLLRDPSEKIRRYAVTALPKLGAGPKEESELLELLKTTSIDRERKYIGQTLDKIGGKATLEVLDRSRGLLPQTEQKVKASVARRQEPGAIRMDVPLARFDRLRIHLRCRKGLETILGEEAEEYIAAHGKFRMVDVHSRRVTLAPIAPFSLADLYTLRCFGSVNFVLGTVRGSDPAESMEALAGVIASPSSQHLLETFTEGMIRYRLDFISKGHQRGAIRLLANRAYARCPKLLNDARRALWSLDIHPTGTGLSVEARPRLSPDPRYYYRRDDVAAASHPPLAASMARLAGRTTEGEIVWDPFCGSGLEVIERSLRGGVQRVFGTDLSPETVTIARTNFAAAKLKNIPSKFVCADFRDYAKVEGLGPASVTLMITNPPMGRRIRIRDMRGLFDDLFVVAATVLKPGGRLIFPNPLRLEPRNPSLKLQFHRLVDLGGYDCRLVVYAKSPP